MPTTMNAELRKPDGLRYTSKNIVASYGEWVRERVEAGWEPTLLTFMFGPLNGSSAAVADAMRVEVERTYGWMLTRRCRRPRQTPNHLKPILIACPDWPVPKHHKNSLRDVTVNDGRHLHGIDLTPPWTRLTCVLADFVDEHQAALAGPNRPIARLHAVTLRKTPEKAVAYVLKSLPRGRADGDDLIILPRSGNEPHGRSSF